MYTLEERSNLKGVLQMTGRSDICRLCAVPHGLVKPQIAPLRHAHLLSQACHAHPAQAVHCCSIALCVCMAVSILGGLSTEMHHTSLLGTWITIGPCNTIPVRNLPELRHAGKLGAPSWP